jgi:hypothetical protein
MPPGKSGPSTTNLPRGCRCGRCADQDGCREPRRDTRGWSPRCPDGSDLPDGPRGWARWQVSSHSCWRRGADHRRRPPLPARPRQQRPASPTARPEAPAGRRGRRLCTTGDTADPLPPTGRPRAPFGGAARWKARSPRARSLAPTGRSTRRPTAARCTRWTRRLVRTSGPTTRDTAVCGIAVLRFLTSGSRLDARRWHSIPIQP